MKLQNGYSYEVPNGDYRVIVRDAFEMSDGDFRIVFEIPALEHPLLDYLAGKNFGKDKPDFINTLVGWLGLEQVMNLMNEDRALDLKALKGLEADIRVQNVQAEGYTKPFASVSAIMAQGTLVKHSKPRAA